MFYQGLGFGKSDSSDLQGFFIRVAWYASSDGSGSQLSSPSDSNIGSVGSEWTELKTSAIQAPQSANSAKFRLVLNSKTAGSLVNVFFDDVSFIESVAPTQTPTESPTPTKSPTSTPTTKVTPTPTLTPALSLTVTPNISISAVLGISSEAARKNSEDLKEPQTTTRVLAIESNTLIFKIFIIVGIVFILACAIVILYYFIHNRK